MSITLCCLVHEVRHDGYAYLGQRDDRLLLLPEKRKVGSSTLPLTTRSEQAILPSHLRQRHLVRCLATARRCPSGTSGDRLWQSATARGLHGPNDAVWMQTTGASLIAVERCSLDRMWMPARGSRSAHALLYPVAVPPGRMPARGR
jgi:hypothetical protein